MECDFLMKKYCELNEDNEEIAKEKQHCVIKNLLNCNVLIMIEPPSSKDREYSLTDAFDKSETIYRILSNAIHMYEMNDKYCDFVGKQALIKIIEELQVSLNTCDDNEDYDANDNNEDIEDNECTLDYDFGNMVIYELIRFWDSRYYMRKFLEEYDVPRPNLKLTFKNEDGMKQYIKSYQVVKECIKNELNYMEQWKLFSQYIANYKGQSLFEENNLLEFKKKWNKMNISSLLNILDKIATQEESIILHLKYMRDSLVIEENGEEL